MLLQEHFLCSDCDVCNVLYWQASGYDNACFQVIGLLLDIAFGFGIFAHESKTVIVCNACGFIRLPMIYRRRRGDNMQCVTNVMYC